MVAEPGHGAWLRSRRRAAPWRAKFSNKLWRFLGDWHGTKGGEDAGSRRSKERARWELALSKVPQQMRQILADLTQVNVSHRSDCQMIALPSFVFDMASWFLSTTVAEGQKRLLFSHAAGVYRTQSTPRKSFMHRGTLMRQKKRARGPDQLWWTRWVTSAG